MSALVKVRVLCSAVTSNALRSIAQTKTSGDVSHIGTKGEKHLMSVFKHKIDKGRKSKKKKSEMLLH